MPIYPYRCDSCQAEREVIAPVDSLPPFCCKQPMTRLITMPAIIKVPFRADRWVDKLDDFQKRQVDKGEKATVPPMEVLSKL